MFLMTILRVIHVLTYRRLQEFRVKLLGYWCYSSCIDSLFWCNSYWCLLFFIIWSTNWCPCSWVVAKGTHFRLESACMSGSAVLLSCNLSTLTVLKFPRVSDTDLVAMIHSFGLWHLNLGDSASCVYLRDRWIHINGVVLCGYQLGCLRGSTLWLLSHISLCLLPI